MDVDIKRTVMFFEVMSSNCCRTRGTIRLLAKFFIPLTVRNGSSDRVAVIFPEIVFYENYLWLILLEIVFYKPKNKIFFYRSLFFFQITAGY